MAIRGTAGPPDPPAPPPTPENNQPTGVPTISGNPRVGEDLTAHTSGIQDDDGLSVPDFTYQWVRVDGDSETDIPTATTATYALETEDAGKRIRIKVSFTDDLLTEEGPLNSAPTGVVNTPATGGISITGTPRVGKVLTANTSGIIDPDGKPASGFTYQWSHTDGVPLAEATNSTYTLRDEDGRPDTLGDSHLHRRTAAFTEGPFVSRDQPRVIVPDQRLGAELQASHRDTTILRRLDTIHTKLCSRGSPPAPIVAGHRHCLRLNQYSTSYQRPRQKSEANINVTLNEIRQQPPMTFPGNALCTLSDPPTFNVIPARTRFHRPHHRTLYAQS